ncbi:MAG TPA: NDP-sugar synthase [Candidatus Hydrogenedentes bacterium]|nr:NDP-sugar synthase [Candidatus Hydrogenedentota bacterium]
MDSAVILAAGTGSRAWPYTGIRRKAALPVANVPLARRMALDLLADGIKDIVVVVDSEGQSVRHVLGDLDGVRFVETPANRGPVDAALHGLAAVSGERVLLCSGDIVVARGTVRALLDGHRANKAEATVLAAETPRGLTASCTTVDVAPDGWVREIWGGGDESHPRFGGMAIARTALLTRYLERDPGIMPNVHVGAMPPREGDAAFAFEMMRRDGIEVHAVMAPGFFVDVDKPWHIVQANRLAAREAVEALESTLMEEGARIDDGADIAPNAKLWLGRGAHIGKHCRIGGSAILGAGARATCGAILEPGVVMGANARCEEYGKIGEGSVIGPNSIVGHCAEFDGVMFDTVYLYHYCCVTALIGTHVDIGAATVCGTWRFDDGIRAQTVQGRREHPECYGSYTFIGDYCRTGVNAMFMPGIKVGYYSCVGGGAIVYDDVPERTLLIPKQEHVMKPWGPEKYGW